jgi:2-(1,2-epoxy-1,2-dihydrophenyl)acetyl-CoA isomerase
LEEYFMDESNYNNILYTINEGVATITFNRPESLNSLNIEALEETRDAIKHLSRAGARAVVLTGNGRGFCAGADLAESSKGWIDSPTPVEIDLGALMEAYYNPFVRDLTNLEMPLITALNGVVAGAGLSIALMGDIVIAARSAVLRAGFADIGLIPDLGGTWLLPHVAGWSRAMAISMLGEALSAEKAHDWGLIYEVVDDAALSARAQEIAGRISRLPAKAVAATKKAFRQSMGSDLSTQLSVEVDKQRALGYTHDFLEGVKAFLQKRAPKFQHR